MKKPVKEIVMDKYTQPDFSSIALITIDTQRDTLDGQSFEIPGTSAILPKIQSLLQAFRRAGMPIIHIFGSIREMEAM